MTCCLGNGASSGQAGRLRGFRGCPKKGKSFPRETVEREFGYILRRLTPAQTTFELAKDMFRNAWDERANSASEESKRLVLRTRQIERDIDNLLTRLVQTENTKVISAYEKRISELEQEKAIAADEIARIATPDHPFEEMFELSMRFLANPYDIWEKGDLEVKKTVLRLVFSRPLVVTRESGVQTSEATLPFKALRFVEQTDSKMVHQSAFEPAPLIRIRPATTMQACGKMKEPRRVFRRLIFVGCNTMGSFSGLPADGFGSRWRDIPDGLEEVPRKSVKGSGEPAMGC